MQKEFLIETRAVADEKGNLLNLKLFTGTPIAFVTYGQNVPNDIENFNPQKTVKEILSTKHEKSS